jgi:hypothetical protein
MRALSILAGLALAANLDLLATEDEEDALTLIKSASFDVKLLSEAEVAGVIKRQWYEAAEALILLSHEKGVDLSKYVREVVKQQRTKLDNLVQKLDPKHAMIQRVSPAFQWAQNSSAVFLQIKYAARFNAPGSLDLKPVNVSFTDTQFILDGMGSHSGVTKQYVLDITLMDYIDTARSYWQAASVGKMTATIAKLHPGKVWPRLLLDKSKKIQNMGVWSAIQEKQKESSSCHSTALLCANKKQVYCVRNDKCVADCSSCEDTQLLGTRCIWRPVTPSYGETKDTNGEKGKWSGSFTVTLNDESESSEMHLYLSTHATIGDVEKEIDNKDAPPPSLVTIPTTGLESYQITLRSVKISDTPTLVAYTKSPLGRRGTPALRQLNDAAVPALAPYDVALDTYWRKEDGNFSANVVVVPANETGVDAYNIYAGKSEKTRLNRKVLLELKKPGTAGSNATQNLTTKIPSQATHLIVVPKNTHGESLTSSAVSLPPVGFSKDEL